MMQDNLYETQLGIEQQMREAGQSKFTEQLINARLKGREASTGSGAALLGKAIEPLIKAIDAFVTTTKRGPRVLAKPYIKMLDAEVVAYLTVRVIIDNIAQNKAIQRTALDIASMLEDEVRMREFDRLNPGLYHVLTKDLRERSSNYQHQRTVIVNRMNKAEIDFESWPQRDKLLVGTKLIDLAIQHTGLIELNKQKDARGRSRYHVVARPEVMDWLDRRNAWCAMHSPLYLPMVVPPRDWSSPWNGGYLTPGLRHLKMIKTRNQSYLEELSNIEMPAVYDALNLIQRTAWHINAPILRAMSHAWDNGGLQGDLPRRELLPLPPKYGFPADVRSQDMEPEHKEALIKWKRATTRTHRANLAVNSQRISMSKKLEVADMFKDYDAIYFPHCLDWRGRLYPVPLFVNPQGDDSAKALLEFSKGKRLGEQGACWLAIHGANLWGQDKVSL